MPDRMWAAQLKLMAPFFVWFTVGLHGPSVRKLVGYSWSRRAEWLHRRFGNLVSGIFRLLPERLRMHPRTRAGWDRATGRIPADTALPETPARNLPPVEHRDNGMHCCPKL